MKKYITFSIIIIACAIGIAVSAQYDNSFYEPDTFVSYSRSIPPPILGGAQYQIKSGYYAGIGVFQRNQLPSFGGGGSLEADRALGADVPQYRTAAAYPDPDNPLRNGWKFEVDDTVFGFDTNAPIDVLSINSVGKIAIAGKTGLLSGKSLTLKNLKQEGATADDIIYPLCVDSDGNGEIVLCPLPPATPLFATITTNMSPHNTIPSNKSTQVRVSWNSNGDRCYPLQGPGLSTGASHVATGSDDSNFMSLPALDSRTFRIACVNKFGKSVIASTTITGVAESSAPVVSIGFVSTDGSLKKTMPFTRDDMDKNYTISYSVSGGQPRWCRTWTESNATTQPDEIWQGTSNNKKSISTGVGVFNVNNVTPNPLDITSFTFRHIYKRFYVECGNDAGVSVLYAELIASEDPVPPTVTMGFARSNNGGMAKTVGIPTQYIDTNFVIRYTISGISATQCTTWTSSNTTFDSDDAWQGTAQNRKSVSAARGTYEVNYINVSPVDYWHGTRVFKDFYLYCENGAGAVQESVRFIYDHPNISYQ